MSPRIVYGLLAAACLSVSEAAAAAPTPAPGLRITHDAVGCMVAERYPTLTARFPPAGRLVRARVYFQAEGSAHWYHVEMAADGEGHSAVLPKPKKGTARVVYYVEAADKALAESRTKDHAARVAAECGSDVAAAVAAPAAQIALGVPSGAPAVPAGFSADGLAGAVAAGGGGVPAAVLAGGGAAVAVGAVVLVAGGGGCEDKGVELAVTFGFNGTVACTQRNTAQQTYHVTNNTCAPVTVAGLSGTSSSTGGQLLPAKQYRRPHVQRDDDDRRGRDGGGADGGRRRRRGAAVLPRGRLQRRDVQRRRQLYGHYQRRHQLRVAQLLVHDDGH